MTLAKTQPQPARAWSGSKTGRHLENVEATFGPFGGRWLVLDAVSDLILVDPVGPGFTSAEWAQHIRAALDRQKDPA